MSNPNQISNQIKVKYDGTAHIDHEMDIFDLAQALEGFGTMIREANSLINEDTPIEIKVDAKFEEGSFGFLVDVVQYGKDVLPYLGYCTAGATIGGATLLEVIKKLQGSKIEYIEKADREDYFNISIKGEKLEISDDVRRLAYSKKMREAIKKVVVDPLSSEGTSNIQFSGENIETMIISNTNSNDYRSPKNDLQQVNPDFEVIEANVKFITAHSFKKTGWRVEYLGIPITVTIADELFMEKISNVEEPYVLNKNFIVKLETKLKKDPIKGEIKTYQILKVLHSAQ